MSDSREVKEKLGSAHDADIVFIAYKNCADLEAFVRAMNSLPYDVNRFSVIWFLIGIAEAHGKQGQFRLEKEIAELREEIESGFMAGSYARLKELQEIERQFYLKKSYELDYSKICHLQKHVYVDGVCAECGHVEDQTRLTPRAADAGLGCPSCFETGDFPVGSNNKICTRCKGTGHV
jgi:hypothetical protein